MDTEALIPSWQRLARELQLRDADALGDELIRRYGEPHRAFHTREHLAQVLTVLEAMDADPRLQLAAWFHDAIYLPGAPWNERRSARLARVRLARRGAAPALREFVAAAVLATASHRAERCEFEPLLDADLSILGAPPPAYRAYAEAIRREYRRVPAALYLKGRRGFLAGMLARAQLFATPYGRTHFEAQARSNLREELTALPLEA